MIVCLHGENVVLDSEGTIDLNGTSFHDFSCPVIPKTRVPMTQVEIACNTVDYDRRVAQSIFFLNIQGLTIVDLCEDVDSHINKEMLK